MPHAPLWHSLSPRGTLSGDSTPVSGSSVSHHLPSCGSWLRAGQALPGRDSGTGPSQRALHRWLAGDSHQGESTELLLGQTQNTDPRSSSDLHFQLLNQQGTGRIDSILIPSPGTAEHLCCSMFCNREQHPTVGKSCQESSGNWVI